MGRSVSEAAAKAVEKSQKKKADVEVGNAEKIRQIRLNIDAGLATTNYYIKGLLEEYDKIRGSFIEGIVPNGKPADPVLDDPKTWEGIGGKVDPQM